MIIYLKNSCYKSYIYIYFIIKYHFKDLRQSADCFMALWISFRCFNTFSSKEHGLTFQHQQFCRKKSKIYKKWQLGEFNEKFWC